MPEPIVAYWEANRTLIERVITFELALVLAIAVWWMWWRLPKREVARLALKIRDPKDRADVEDNYRKTIGQAIGGITVLLGAGLAYQQFTQQQQASHDLLISNQVSKGFEQLGNEKLVVRLGGIYALEGVMNTSDQYHQPVVEALSAFVREGTSATTRPKNMPLSTDIQAALTVIGRRSDGSRGVDLNKANIAGANLFQAKLSVSDLSGADLSGVDLFEADLSHAFLTDANLSGANLDTLDLSGARLGGANLTGTHGSATTMANADLSGANLSGARLLLFDMANAKLTGANLTDASLTIILTGADLTDANLTRANLKNSNLTRANLTGAQIDQKQLDDACGSDAKLPPGLTLKPCPP